MPALMRSRARCFLKLKGADYTLYHPCNFDCLFDKTLTDCSFHNTQLNGDIELGAQLSARALGYPKKANIFIS